MGKAKSHASERSTNGCSWVQSFARLRTALNTVNFAVTNHDGCTYARYLHIRGHIRTHPWISHEHVIKVITNDADLL